MKVNRINLTIPLAKNKHRPYICNEILALMNRYHFGGEFRTDTIKLSGAPEVVGKILKRLDIKV